MGQDTTQEAEASPIVVIDKVGKVFTGEDGEEKAALSDVSLSIRRGGIYGIIGLSGAGKSTLIRLINGIERATSGTVTVDGHRIGDLDARQLRVERRRIGMIFQQFNLMPSRTVFDNILFPLKDSDLGKDERRERVTHLLSLVGLDQKADAYPGELSGGQQQRVAIARALASNPKILLCDEATSALDPATTVSILHLLREVNRSLGVTVIIVTHQMSVVKEICDRVAVLDSGRLVEEGSVFSVFANPQAKLTRSFIATTSNIAKLGELVDGGDEDGDGVPDGEPLVRLKPGEKLVSIRYVHKGVFEPLIATVIRRFGVDINILLSDVEVVDGHPIGGTTGIWSGSEDGIRQAIAYLKDKDINVEVLR
ncbi:methionine ABC transporter ATP-binding protein [Bifidobacterium vespertilionis]|uniref:ATP-binding cassette domain-containing protein n=1 Tax=Bifidobacterium vespertilionis TaxID=2562524 RepID=A0A5J5E2N6_9BIFI|nr:ATP-binding cassette domain-containing protein [Bifidobacterium vespertilionis]KAA8819589.1 ATP-binding cassette domain-containing protein [Bifidobacterium vespertilionis]KAA8823403.1 ATP-binding cassette domain-containing protein [Bifidobacterium vespertilionis]